MVFELKSNVYDRLSVDTIAKTTKLYKALQIDLGVDNHFNEEVTFKIQIQYERANPKAANQKGKDKKAIESKPGAKAGNQGNTATSKGKDTSNSAIPEPFFCKNETIKI